ncbi:transglycosylase domain-containing protein [Thermoflavimicrobium daqui]|uniref:Uncharacterized protein n=1 Tax=Thermoflavimicrobium daqui TaxID=2137476 RepID=A0A364K1N8_9BACL|nr:transglycosylase domain-containing protein [Thermoflavimicrobium daqui]RAL21843.1 hypothetical protein DL897_15615 [Thermoflavimicrobium daqui]
MNDKNRDDVHFAPKVRSERIGPQLTRRKQKPSSDNFFGQLKDKVSGLFSSQGKKQDPNPRGSGGGGLGPSEPKGPRQKGPGTSKKPGGKWGNLFSLKWFVLVLVTSFLLMIGFAATIMVSSKVLPLENMDQKDTPAIIYGKNNVEIAKMSKEAFEPISMKELKQHNQLLVDTIKKVEDARFDSHNGVDYEGLARAVFNSIFKGKTEGGGTITMQVARNVILNDLDQTMTRKLREMAAAWSIEAKYGKERILEAYLNGISFGNGIKGVQLAAKAYFNKDLKKDKLTTGEVAILAGLPKAPEGYNSYKADPVQAAKSKERLKKRQDIVLMIMAREDDMQPLISQEEKSKWQNAPLPLQPKSNVKKHVSKNHSTVFDELIKEEIEKKFPQFKAKDLHKNGLKIYTNIDPNMQKAVEQALKDDSLFEDRFGKIPPQKVIDAGVTVVNPKDGTIVALGGGRNYQKGLTSNWAFTKIQPGSTMKPLTVYGPAVELKRFDENTMLTDEQIKVPGKEKPIKNFDNKYYNQISMSEALKKSLNASTIWLLQNHVGLDKAFEYGKKLGLPLVDPQDKNYSPLGLGGLYKGVSTLDMAQAYSVFPNNGAYYEAHLIKEIKGKLPEEDKEISVKAEYKPKQVFSKQTAWYMTRMLRNNVMAKDGTKNAKLDDGREAAGKSGTTQEEQEGWFVGFTPDLVTSVSVFYIDKPKGDQKYHYTGSTAPAKLFSTIMSEGLKGTPAKKFVRPEGVQDPKAPLKDLNIKASYKDGAIKLSWNSAGSGVKYNVERSEDGKNYEMIAQDLITTSYSDPVDVGLLDKALSFFGKEKKYHYRVTVIDKENPGNKKAGVVIVRLTDDQSGQDQGNSGEQPEPGNQDHDNGNGNGNGNGHGNGRGNGNGNGRGNDEFGDFLDDFFNGF